MCKLKYEKPTIISDNIFITNIITSSNVIGDVENSCNCGCCSRRADCKANGVNGCNLFYSPWEEIW